VQVIWFTISLTNSIMEHDEVCGFDDMLFYDIYIDRCY
jgi:hypothetical protein